MNTFKWSAAAFAALLVMGMPLAAQEQEFEPERLPGWSFTPSITFGTLFDSNLSLTSQRADAESTDGDTMFRVQPGGELGFVSRRTEFLAGYRGYLRRYMDFDALNGYDQRAAFSLRRAATKRVSFSINEVYSDVPTTDETELNGVPFRRAGSRTNRVGAGVDARLTKLTTLSTRYDMTWARFDQTDEFLNNGIIHAGQVRLDRQLTERLTLGGEYGLRFAHIDDDSRDMVFNDAGGSFTFVAAPRTKVFGRGGVSTMFDRLAQERHTGPYFGMGIEYAAEHATVGARFDRQFLPSFGFGGSNQTQELGAYVRAPLARRVYSNGSFTWRHAIPFLTSSIEADTYWLRGSLGYRAARWINVEGFYLFGRHDPIEVGGDVTRHRIGVQVVLMQPMRIQ